MVVVSIVYLHQDVYKHSVICNYDIALFHTNIQLLQVNHEPVIVKFTFLRIISKSRITNDISTIHTYIIACAIICGWKRSQKVRSFHSKHWHTNMALVMCSGRLSSDTHAYADIPCSFVIEGWYDVS